MLAYTAVHKIHLIVTDHMRNISKAVNRVGQNTQKVSLFIKHLKIACNLYETSLM